MVIATMSARNLDKMNDAAAERIAKRLRVRKVSGIFTGGKGSRIELRISRAAKKHVALLSDWLNMRADGLLTERQHYNPIYRASLHV